MEKKQLFLFGLILLIFFSCSNSNQQEHILSSAGSSLMIKINKKTKSTSFGMQYVEIGDTAFLAYENKSENAIILFDLKEKKQVDKKGSL